MAHIHAENTVLLVIDVQERFAPVIADYEDMLERSKVLIAGCKALEIPVLLTEQYPEGLGPTVPEIQTALEDADCQRFEKRRFSLVEEELEIELRALGRSHLILCGIETHVCVAQSAEDLMDQGYRVHLAVDAISSRYPEDKRIALQQLQHDGAKLASVEGLLFRLMRCSTHPSFKEISALIR